MLCTLLTTLPCQLTKPGGPRKGIEVIFGHRRYDGDRKRFQSNRAGPCVPSLAPGALCALSLAPSDSKHSIYCGYAWKARIILFWLSHSSTIIWFKLRNDTTRRPIVWSRLIASCDSSHRSAQIQGFFSPRGQPFLPCLVALPLRREACSLLPAPLFVARLGLFLRLLLRASLVDVAWRRVASVQPASRRTICFRLGNKTFG